MTETFDEYETRRLALSMQRQIYDSIGRLIDIPAGMIFETENGLSMTRHPLSMLMANLERKE